MGHFDSSTRDGRGEVGNLSDRFAGLNVRDYSSAESLFQVMKAVEDAEITIREQLEENDRLKGEILQKNRELEKYKLDIDKYLRTSVAARGSSGELVHTHHAMNVLTYPAESVKERSKWMDNSALEGSQRLSFNEREHGFLNNAETTSNPQTFRPSSRSISPGRHKNVLEQDQRIISYGNGLVPTSEMDGPSSQSKQNLLHKIRDQEEEISLLRRHISDYSVKESKLRNEKYVLEKRIAHMRMAFDQQQKDLVDAAAKALSYRQDIIEENIRLTYTLQEAQQEKSTYVSSLLPLLAENGLQPPTSDALSIVSNVKVLFKHLHEKFIITEEKLKGSQYHFAPWRTETANASNIAQPIGANLIFQPQDLIHFETNPRPKNNLEIVPQPSYSHMHSPVASPLHAQTRADWEVLGQQNLQATHGDIVKNPNHVKIGRTSPTSRNHVAEEVPEQVEATHGDSHVVLLNAENEERLPLTNDASYGNGLDDSKAPVHQQDGEPSLQLLSGNIPHVAHGHDDQSHPYLPPVLEEPKSSFSEAAEDDPLPAIEGLQIFGEAFPGRELQACGYSINGTTSCNFEWVRYLEDGSINYIEGAKHPNYLVTADDVNSYLAIEVQPLDNRKRKGELVKVFANEQRKIACDPQMQEQIERTLSVGHASYEVSISTGVLNFWENAVLVIKKKGYVINCSGPRGGMMEKFSPNTEVAWLVKSTNSNEGLNHYRQYQHSLPTHVGDSEYIIAVCSGQSTEFSIQGSDGVEHLLRTSSSSSLRDTIVLTLRLFKTRAVQKRKVQKKGFFK